MAETINNAIRQTLYDTISYSNTAVSTGDVYMFSIPSDGTNKLDWQTNQKKANQCQYTVMNIIGLYFKVFTNSVTVLPAADDVEKIVKNLSLTIRKNTVPVFQIPISEIGGGNQLDGFITNTNNSTLSISRNGVAHANEVFKFLPSSTGTGIQFVENEQMDIRLTVESAFTPSAVCYGQLGLICDTWQRLN